MTKRYVIFFAVFFILIDVRSQNMEQILSVLFNVDAGVTLVADGQISLKQSTGYLISMSMFSTSNSLTLSTINSRIDSKNINLRQQNNVSMNVFYHLEGEPFYDYIVTLPPYIVVTKPGVPDMIIEAPTTMPITKGDGIPTGSLVASLGNTDFTVNGTLDVGKGETKGTYVGTFALVVNCN